MKRYIICSLCVLLATLLALGSAMALAEEGKRETVFVLTDALGQTREVFVTERAEDGQEAEAAEPAQTDAPLPVEVRFQYELDGEAIEPAELNGKSGHLVIRVDYASTLTGTAEVKGERVELPIPFLASTILPINEDVCSNVEVTHGQVVNTGRVTTVVCYGLPGLSEALNVGGYSDVNLNVDIPTGAVISADVVNYASEDAYTVVTGIPEGITDTALPFSFNIEGLSDDPKEAMNQVTDGVSALLSGVDQIAKGAGKLSTGANLLNLGASGLSEGLSELDGNSAALTDGADQIVAGILETVNQTLGASAEAFAQAGIALNALTLDNYAEELDRIEAAYLAAVENGESSETYLSLEALREKLDGVKAFRDGLADYTEAVGKAAKGAETVAGGVSKLKTGAGQLADGTKTLNEAVQKIGEALDGDVKEILDRVKALGDLRYDGYQDQTAGATLFIFRTEGV